MASLDRAIKLKLRAAALSVLAELDLDGPPPEAVGIVEHDDDADVEIALTIRQRGADYGALAGTNGRATVHEHRGNPLSPFSFSPLDLDIVKTILTDGKMERKKVAARTNGIGDNNKLTTKFSIIFGRLVEVGVLIEGEDGEFSVLPRIVELMPTLRLVVPVAAASDDD